MNHTFTATLWLYPGKAGWYFVTIEPELGEILEAEHLGPRRGFGSIRVEVSIASSTWRTSIFPDKNLGYLLPIKKAIREAQGLRLDRSVTIHIRVLD